LSDSLLGTGPGKRESFVYFNDQSFGGIRVKNYKTLYTAKDTWLGQDQNLKIPALYDLWWDPGEQYDIVFNGAAPYPRRPEDVARPVFRSGQWLDRSLHHPGPDQVLGRAQDPPEHPLPAVRRRGV
jgi:hypothetical protein